MNSKSGNWITLAIIFALGTGAANQLQAERLTATPKGSPIDLTTQTLGNSAQLEVSDSGSKLIRVSATPEQQGTLHLFDLEAPMIDADGYAVVGEVRYEGVKKEGFLEMWNHMPAEKGGTDIGVAFFSRTLDLSGPLAKLSGDSEWRPFQLPAFINDGSGRRPLKLTLNVVLPGEGTVEIRDLKLKTLRSPVVMNPPAFGRIAVLGIFAFVFGAVLVGLTFLLKRRKAESELRRIQALDS